jgi:hypothetical protein
MLLTRMIKNINAYIYEYVSPNYMERGSLRMCDPDVTTIIHNYHPNKLNYEGQSRFMCISVSK